MLRKELHEENRQAWNEATPVHNSHKRDQAGFLGGGGSTLFPEEVELLRDIGGLSLVHLQCNAGQDTLSLAHLGAKVTGVDISDSAIEFARQLSEESGIPATFYRSDVYDWLAEAAGRGEQFDIAFGSYGFLAWLSDIGAWARGVASILKPGGRLVFVEFHPASMMFDHDWTLKYPYFANGGVITWEEGIHDYVAASGEGLAPSGYVEGVKDFRNPYKSHEFQWSLGEIVTALLDAGLSIRVFKEYPYSNGCKLFDGMRELPGNRMVPPESAPNVPLMFGIVAEKA
ncbi:MAG: class I SAM-dependent methyltransferase [Chloroflexia bacterium]